jgi:hypothetical protein
MITYYSSESNGIAQWILAKGEYSVLLFAVGMAGKLGRK